MEKIEFPVLSFPKRTSVLWKWAAALWLIFLWLTLRYIPFTLSTAAETREYNHTQIQTSGV